MWLPEAGAFALSAKGTSASDNLALPAAVSALLVASSIEMRNHHISLFELNSFPFH
jgi:hypothetical protein